MQVKEMHVNNILLYYSIFVCMCLTCIWRFDVLHLSLISFFFWFDISFSIASSWYDKRKLKLFEFIYEILNLRNAKIAIKKRPFTFLFPHYFINRIKCLSRRPFIFILFFYSSFKMVTI